MAAVSVSSFDSLAGQEQTSRLNGMRWNLHRQLCDKIRRDYLIRRDDEILRSGDGVSPDNEEEDNRVSSENREGRLDDDSGSNDVRLKNGGSIEEPEHKTAETPGPTDGLESFVQSVIVQWLREHVNLDNWETIFQNFDLDNEFWFSQDTDGLSTDNKPLQRVRFQYDGQGRSSFISGHSMAHSSTDSEEEDEEVSSENKEGSLDNDSESDNERHNLLSDGDDERTDNEEEDEEEDTDVSSENKEGSLDDHSGSDNERHDLHFDGGDIVPLLSNDGDDGEVPLLCVGGDTEDSDNEEGSFDDYSGRDDKSLNSLFDGSGIEESDRTAKHPLPSTVISHGTDGFESDLQSVIVSLLSEHVTSDKQDLQNLHLSSVLRTYPLYEAGLDQIINNIGTDLLQMLKTNPTLSLVDLKVYFFPISWSSKQRVEFWSHLSDELLSRADELKELMLELERTWQLHFGEKRNDKVDDELLSSADELKKLMLGLVGTWQPLFGEKRNDKMLDKLFSRVDKLKKLMSELERMWRQHFGEKRNDKIDELLAKADKLILRADELKELRLELERTWQLHFGEKWNDEIDEEWIKKFGEKDWGPHLGEKWIDKIDEKWIKKNGKRWDKIDEKWIKKNGKKWIDKTIEKWIKKVDPKYKPRESDFKFVRGLLRFMRNRWHHSDKFQESQGLRNGKSFYEYFDTLFPCLLMVSYGVANRFCRKDPWFEEYRWRGNLCRSTVGRHAL